jgi:hypothetical protein
VRERGGGGKGGSVFGFKLGDCVYHKPSKKLGIVDIVYSTGALDLTWILDKAPLGASQYTAYHVVAPNDCEFVTEVDRG